jgi:predicted glycosyltransferase
VGDVASQTGVIVPRVRPRQEQLLRAARLSALGHLDVLHPDQLSAAALTRWLGGDLHHLKAVNGKIDLLGLQRVPQLAREAVDSWQPRKESLAWTTSSSRRTRSRSATSSNGIPATRRPS